MKVSNDKPPTPPKHPPPVDVVRRLTKLYGDSSVNNTPTKPTAVSAPSQRQADDGCVTLLDQAYIAAQGGAIMMRDSVVPPRPPSLLLTVQAEREADETVRLRSPTLDSGLSRSASPLRPPLSAGKGAAARELQYTHEQENATGEDYADRDQEEGVQQLLTSPVELQELVSHGSRHSWSAIAPSAFKVRGANYLHDGVKVEAPLLSQCLAVELFRSKEAVANVAGRPDSPVATLAQRCDVPLKKIFVVVIIIPTGKYAVHIAMYFGVYAAIDTAAPAASRLLDRFLNADDHYRNMRFKVFTKVAKGPLPVRLATPQRPAISGRSVPHHFHITPQYVEVDMDVSKDPTAARALKICKPASNFLVVDVGFILEGKQEDELPEMVFGAARLNHLNISDAKVPLLNPAETSSRNASFRHSRSPSYSK